MQEIVLQFSDRVSLGNVMAELARHQSALSQQLSGQSDGERQVVADLSGLKDVDTSALSLLLHLDRLVRGQIRTPLVIRAAPANLLSLARLSSLTEALHWEN